jgi:hypothetical protein
MKKIKGLVTWISNTKTCDFCALFNLRQRGYNTHNRKRFCYFKHIRRGFYYICIYTAVSTYLGGICRGARGKKSAVENTTIEQRHLRYST